MVSGRPTDKQTIRRVLDLASWTDGQGRYLLTLSEIARRCGINRNTVRIILRRAAAAYAAEMSAEKKSEKFPDSRSKTSNGLATTVADGPNRRPVECDP